MGGHAFHWLNTPRISQDLYLKVREQTSASLRELFAHVVIPTELPSKTDYGDIDFLVATPLHAHPASAFDWPKMVTKIKLAFNTSHGRRGHLNPTVMYFAIPAPGREDEFWVQVDVKVCEDAALFEWQRFQLNYASAAKMLGSMVKPLGLTLDPEGLHIRVEEMEKTNLAGSMVLLTKEPRDVLKIAGLDKRILNEGFRENEELYQYFAGSWLFNPAHFAERLKSEKYADHLEDRSAPWVYFVTKWMPQHYHGYCLPALDSKNERCSTIQTADLQSWYANTRVLVREKVFTMFPAAAPMYYSKRQACLKEFEELRLRKLLMSVVPPDQTGWTDDIPKPRIIVKPSIPATPEFKPLVLGIETGILTPPASPKVSAHNVFGSPPSPPSSRSTTGSAFGDDLSTPLLPSSLHSTPLLLDALPRTPPTDQECTPRPAPNTMSLEARLLCLARWTLFDPSTGSPYLAQEPREKKFVMSWADSDASDEALVAWARDMWWTIWVRQHYVNHVGMWKRRFAKEEEKEMKRRAREREEGERKNKTLGRLRVVNERLGVVGV